MSSQTANDLLGLVEKRERVARRRIVVFSIIPVVLAFALLWFTFHQIRSAYEELASVNAQIAEQRKTLQDAEAQTANLRAQVEVARADLRKADEARNESNKRFASLNQQFAVANGKLQLSEEQLKQYSETVASLNQQVALLKEQLWEALNYKKHSAQVDSAVLMKYLANRYPEQSALFMDMLNLEAKAVPYKPGGSSESEGFDSPSFAAYILQKHGLLRQPLANVRYRLRDVLPPKSAPDVGDLVFYSVGDTMFFCLDDQGHRIVIGMTPLGILAMRADFAAVLGYAAVPYGR